MTHRRAYPLTAFVFLVLAGTSAASTVLRMSNEDLAKRANTIFLGKCVEKEAKAQGSFVVTEYVFEIEDSLKGSAEKGKRFTFKALGGTVGDKGYAISGAPTYAKDEEVVLFLDQEHPKTGCRHAIGLAQGKFTVKLDPETKKKHLVRDLGGLTFVDASGKVDEKPAAGEKLELEAFLKEIRGHVEKARK